jgi:hypothetical protein
VFLRLKARRVNVENTGRWWTHRLLWAFLMGKWYDQIYLGGNQDLRFERGKVEMTSIFCL